MNSWVYLFSKFTSEALLFEALVICVLTGSYAAFWVIRKRRYGAADIQVPAGAVKYYLNDLIVNAEQLRLQLFGLLADKSATPTPSLVGISADPNLAKRLLEFEAKITEQAKALETITKEKLQIEKDLASARANPGQPGTDAQDPTQKQASAAMLKKITELEGKLAEYSVIEDDLANLKRLQQENAQLKEALTSKGGALPPVPAPPPDTFSPDVAADTSMSSLPSPEELTASPSPEVPPPDTQSDDPAVPSFPPSSDSVPPSPESATPTPSSTKTENQEADLVAEFEKMLKS